MLRRRCGAGARLACIGCPAHPAANLPPSRSGGPCTLRGEVSTGRRHGELSALNHAAGRRAQTDAVVRNRRLRRTLALGLIATGGLLLLLAPSAHYGLIAFALGVVLELAGIAIERRGPR